MEFNLKNKPETLPTAFNINNFIKNVLPYRLAPRKNNPKGENKYAN